MKTSKMNKKRITAFVLSFLLVMQQSLTYQVLASTITSADGTVIPANGGANVWNFRPDALNVDGKIGFKQFDQIILDQNGVINFNFQGQTQTPTQTGTNSYTLTDRVYNIDTFVNLVNKNVKIDGIVNAVKGMGSAATLRGDGNLVFIAPGGVVVGSTGVLNVGNLSVITPTNDSYNNLKNYLQLPQQHTYRMTHVDRDADGNYTLSSPDTTSNTAILFNKTFDISTLRDGNGNTLVIGVNPETVGEITYNKNITVDNGGKVAARGNVNLQGGNVNVNGILLAGVKDGTVLTSTADATTLFSSLVNDSASNSANMFSNTDGNISITSKKGTSIGSTGKVRNLAYNGNITINNSGTDGTNINGQLYNVNGNLSVNNTAGQLLVNTSGDVQNKGTMTFSNTGSGTKLALNGKVLNDGTLNVTNSTGTDGLLVGGNVTNNTGAATFTNNKGLLNVANGGKITSNGTSLTLTNSVNGTGMTVAGTVDNTAGTVELTNHGGKLLVDTTGIVKNNGSSILVKNDATGGMNIKGHVTNTNKTASVNFENSNSNMTIGDASTNYNIDSNAKVNITVKNGNLLNNGVAKTLIRTTENANLEINVTNGAIGENVGPCIDGVCTGIGTDARNLTKSINTEIAGNIKAISTGTSDKSLVNMASLNTSMRVDQIKANGRVILLADASTKGSSPYSIVNRATNSDNPNVEGTGISMIASGAIGESNKALTFRQNGVPQNNILDDAQNSHNSDTHTSFTKPSQGVDMLAIDNINVKGLDADNGNKLNTNVCAIISREGDVKAEFSGSTYIDEVTAANNIDITTRGKNLYVNHLGETTKYTTDYYGNNANIHPAKAKLTALDLGSYWTEEEEPSYDHAADSTIVVKNGTLRGQGKGRPAHEQDLLLVADNAYAGGYYFNMGKHRGLADNGKMNVSTVTKDGTTNTLTNPDGTKIVSIRGKAIRPEDVAAVGGETDNKATSNNNGRNYYYGGSEQGYDDGYDGVKNGNEYVDNPTGDEQGKENDDDNLVIPEEEKDGQLDNDTDTDTDTDIDLDTDADLDNDLDTDTDTDTDNDNDTDIDTDTDSDIDTDTDIDIDDDNDGQLDNDTDTDTDTDIDTDTDSDLDNDLDTDTDTDTDNDNDMDNDTDTDIDTDMDNDTDTDVDTDNDTDTDIDEPDPEPVPEPTPEPEREVVIDFKDLYKQRVVTDRVDSIDKRQYMRFNANDNANPITFESSNDVVAITDISRGGVSLKHNKKLKVGDIVPVHLKYGDLEITANAKVVSANDVKAGAQFIDLDQATANKLLYLSLLQKDEPIAQTIMNISTTSIDD